MSFDLGGGILVGVGGTGSGVTLQAYDPGIPPLEPIDPNNAFGMGQNVVVTHGGIAIGFGGTVRNAVLIGSGEATGAFAGLDITDPTVFSVGAHNEVSGSSVAVFGIGVLSLSSIRTAEVGVWNLHTESVRLRQAGSRYVGQPQGEGGSGITSHCLTLLDTTALPWTSGSEDMKLQENMWTMAANQHGELRIDYNFGGTVNSVYVSRGAVGELAYPFETTNRDSGKTLVYDGADGVELTISSLSGVTRLIQLGAGKVTLVDGDQTVINIDGLTRTRGAGSIVEIFGIEDRAIISGDLEEAV